jgi:hypothetical protein
MRPMSRGLRWLARFSFLVPLAVFIWTGNRGIDFGRHWDEPLILNDIQTSLRTRLLLPTGTCNYPQPGLSGGNYEYPSALYWIGMGMTVPHILHDGLDPSIAQPTDFVSSKLFAIRYRQACLAISSLMIVWVFFLAWRLTGRWAGGFVAACFLAGSWELAYHARWIATDTILAQFAAMCLMLCAAALETRPSCCPSPGARKLIFLAAVVAGLATGTKYPGGLLLLPVLTAAWFVRPRTGAIPWLAKLLAISIVTFLITTPGALLQPWNFVAWLRFNHLHYAVQGHFGHTILNHTAHLLAMLQYLAFVLFSHFPLIAIAITSLAVIGIIAVFRRSWRLGLLLLPFPMIYIGYFSQQIVMLVRNLLILAPFLAVFAAAGSVLIFDLLRNIRGRWGIASAGSFAAAIGIAIAVNFGWLIYASASMHERHQVQNQLSEAASYLEKHPDLRVFPSDTVAAFLHLPMIPAAAKLAHRDVVLAFAQEDADQNNFWSWPANLRNLTLATFGPFEVNFNYYPNWMDNRLVLLDMNEARRVPVAQIERVVRRHDVAGFLDPDEQLLAYLNCGSVLQITANGITIRAINGTEYPCARDVAVPQPDAITIQADNHQLEFQISGLDPNSRYRVGWSWWDWNTGHRYESTWAVTGDAPVSPDQPMNPAVSFQLQGRTRLPAWPLMVDPQPHKLRAEWPPKAHYRTGVATTNEQSGMLPPAAYRGGRFRFVVRKEAGPDVVITSLWIARQSSP